MKRGSIIALLILGCALAAFLAPKSSVLARLPGPAGPLRVATMPLEPFVIEDGDQLSGFSVDLWEAVAKRLGVDYQWVEVETVEEILAAVRDGQADVGIAGISITPEREEIVDFTLPTFNAGLRVMTTMHSGASVTTLIGIIFSPAMLRILGFGFIILLVMAHIIWLAERGSNPAIPKAYPAGIWEALWWSLATLSTQVYGVFGETRSRYKRLLAMVLVVISIVLIAQFTASITAALTVHQLNASISSAADLPGKRIATVGGTTGADYLAKQHHRPIEVERISDAYPLLEAGQVDAIVFDSPVLLYYAATRGRGVVQVVGPTLQDEYYGIAIPSGSSLREPLNEALLGLMQDGVYTEIHTKWFGSN